MSEEKKIKIIITLNGESKEFFASKNGIKKFNFKEPLEIEQKVLERLQRMVQEYFDIKDCCPDANNVEISDIN